MSITDILEDLERLKQEMLAQTWYVPRRVYMTGAQVIAALEEGILDIEDRSLEVIVSSEGRQQIANWLRSH